MDQPRRPRGVERSRERRRSRSRSPPPRREAAASAPNSGAFVACTRANLQPLFTSFKEMMKLVEVERFLIAHHRRGRAEDSPLTVVRGLVVRYNYDGHRLGLVGKYLVEDGEDKVAVQASLQGGAGAPPSRCILLECLSSQNSLADPAWQGQGERELAELAADTLRHGWRLPLAQVAGAAWRRKAALRWHARYRGEPDMAAHLHRLIEDLEDRAELHRAARQFELLPQSTEPEQRQQLPRRESPRQQQLPPRGQSPRRQQQQQQQQQQERRRSPPLRKPDSRSRSPQRQHRDLPDRQQQQQRQQGRQRAESPPQRTDQQRGGSQRQLRESPSRHQRPQQTSQPHTAGQVPAGNQPRPTVADAAAGSQLPPHLSAHPQLQLLGGGGGGGSSALAGTPGMPGMPGMPLSAASHIVPSFLLPGGNNAAEPDAGSRLYARATQRHGDMPGGASVDGTGVFNARQATGRTLRTVEQGQPPATDDKWRQSTARPDRAAAADTRPAAPVHQPHASANEASAAATAAAGAGSKRKRAPLVWEAQEPQPGDAPLALPDKKPAAEPAKPKDKKQKLAAAAAAAAAAGGGSGAGGAAETKSGKQGAAATAGGAAAGAATGKFQITVRNLPPEGDRELAHDEAAQHGKGGSSSRQAAAAAAATSQPLPASRRERRESAAVATDAAVDGRPMRQAAPTERGGSMPPGFGGGSSRHKQSTSPSPSTSRHAGSSSRQAQYAPSHDGSGGDGDGKLTVRVRLPPAAAADGEDYSSHQQQTSRNHQQQQPASHGHQSAAAAAAAAGPSGTLAGRFDGLNAQYGQQMHSPSPLAAAEAAAASELAFATFTAASGALGPAHYGYPAPQLQQQQEPQLSVFPAAALAAVAQLYGQGFDPTAAVEQLAYLQHLQQTPTLAAGLPASYPQLQQQQAQQQQQQAQQQLVMPSYATAAPGMADRAPLQAADGYGSGSMAGQAERGRRQARGEAGRGGFRGGEGDEGEEREGQGRRRVGRSRSRSRSRGETGRMVEIERRERSTNGGGGSGSGHVIKGRVVEADGDRDRSAEGGGGGGKSDSATFWCPMWQWESEVVHLLQSRAAGVRLLELQASHPLPPCWAQTPEAFYAYLAIRKQLFTVHHPQKSGRDKIMITPAKGARFFLNFKRSLLHFLAEHLPRVSAKDAHSYAATGSLQPALSKEAGADFVGFVNKYLRDEVGIVRRGGGDGGGNDRGQGGGSGSGGGFLLELRGFSRSAGGRDAPAVPPLGQACMSWHSKGSCKFGDACYNTHVPRRSFTDRTDKHSGSKR